MNKLIDIKEYSNDIYELSNGQIELVKFVRNSNNSNSLSTFKDNRVNMLFYRRYDIELNALLRDNLSTFDSIINLNNKLKKVTYNLLSINKESFKLFNSSFKTSINDNELVIDCKLCGGSHKVNGNYLINATQRLKNGKNVKLMKCINKSLSSNDFEKLSINKDNKLKIVDSPKKNKIKELSNNQIELVKYSDNKDSIFIDKRINKSFNKKYSNEVRNLKENRQLSPFDNLIKVNKKIKLLTFNLLEIIFDDGNLRNNIKVKCHICNCIHVVDIIKLRNLIYKLHNGQRATLCDEAKTMNVSEYKELSKRINFNKECKIIKEEETMNYAIDKAQKQKIKELSNEKIELILYNGAAVNAEESVFIDKRINRKFKRRYNAEYISLKNNTEKLSPYDAYISNNYKLQEITSNLLEIDFKSISLDKNFLPNNIDLKCHMCNSVHRIKGEALYSKIKQLKEGYRTELCNKFGKMNIEEYKEFANSIKSKDNNQESIYNKVKDELLSLLDRLQYKEFDNNTNVKSELSFINSNGHKLFVGFNQSDNTERDNDYFVSRMKSAEYFNINTKTNNLLLSLLLDSSALSNALSTVSRVQYNFDELQKEYDEVNNELSKLKEKESNKDKLIKEDVSDKKNMNNNTDKNKDINISINKDKNEVNISINFDNK